MLEEYYALQNQGTWILIVWQIRLYLDEKWVYNIKWNPDGIIALYEDRLVAQNFNQEHGINYNKTYTTIVKLTIIQVFLMISLHWWWEIL